MVLMGVFSSRRQNQVWRRELLTPPVKNVLNVTPDLRDPPVSQTGAIDERTRRERLGGRSCFTNSCLLTGENQVRNTNASATRELQQKPATTDLDVVRMRAEGDYGERPIRQ